MEDFVSFEIAKKLKEKGYPFNTFHHYDKDGGIIVALCDCDERCEYPMPEIHQVLKWLREEKKIAINIEFIPYVWQYKIFDMSFEERFKPCGITLFSDYEEAALAGIEYVLDNLI